MNEYAALPRLQTSATHSVAPNGSLLLCYREQAHALHRATVVVVNASAGVSPVACAVLTLMSARPRISNPDASRHVLRLRPCMPRTGAVARPQHDAAKGSRAITLAAELNAAASALNNAPALLSILSTSQDVVRATRCLLLPNARSRALYALTRQRAAGRDSSRHPGPRRLFHGQAASGAVSAGWRAGWGHRRCSAAHLVSAAARVGACWWLTPARRPGCATRTRPLWTACARCWFARTCRVRLRCLRLLVFLR